MKPNRTKITLSNEHESYRPDRGQPTGLQVVLFGTRCQQTAMTFSSLLQRGIRVPALMLSSAKPGAPALRRLDSGVNQTRIPMIGMTVSDTIEQIARDSGSSLFEVSDITHASVQESVASFQPDLILTSCFPQRIPTTLVRTARYGGLNLHPSLLPRYRGPDPLFWLYRDGVSRTGVSVHQLSGRFDAGDIVLQEEFDIPVGLPGTTLDRQCAEIGGGLLAQAVSEIAHGTATPVSQDARLATYQTWPTKHDLVIPNDWPAQRCWHFVRGVVPLGYHPLVEIGPDRVAISQAIEYRPDQPADFGVRRVGDRITIAAPDGTVTFHVAK